MKDFDEFKAELVEKQNKELAEINEAYEMLEKIKVALDAQKANLNECEEKKTVELTEEQAMEVFTKLAKGEQLDEGLFGAAVGVTIGPKIGDIICRALGIEKGLLWDLFHSRIFTTTVGAYF